MPCCITDANGLIVKLVIDYAYILAPNNNETSSKTTVGHQLTEIIDYRYIAVIYSMMTSSNGNIFRVTGPLCGEFTGHRWIPLTKNSDAELWCFLWSLNKQLIKQSRRRWFETQSCSLWRHCNDHQGRDMGCFLCSSMKIDCDTSRAHCIVLVLSKYQSVGKWETAIKMQHMSFQLVSKFFSLFSRRNFTTYTCTDDTSNHQRPLFQA